MGTFGEIAEPQSRNIWEEWDDNITESGLAELKWHRPLKIADKIDTLFIFEGKCIFESVNMHPKSRLQLKNFVACINLRLFELSPSVAVCAIKEHHVGLANDIVELLKPILCKSTDIVTIQTKPLMEYLTQSCSYSPFIIRMLTTSTPATKFQDLNFQRLEQPNLVTGVAAGVTCLREHLDMPAITLVYYIELAEAHQTDEIQKILEKFQIIDGICATQVTGILNTNLYI